jgi:hypothetical protein
VRLISALLKEPGPTSEFQGVRRASNIQTHAFIQREGLQLISSICWEKAAEAAHGQDDTLAKAWEQAAKRIETLSISEAILRISRIQ